MDSAALTGRQENWTHTGLAGQSSFGSIMFFRIYFNSELP